MVFTLNLKLLSKIFSAIQIVIVALPIPGYIHPDEFFQCSEVMASDILDLKSIKTWEWNITRPSRNIVFPFISCGIPLWILKNLHSYFGLAYSTHLLLSLPRCGMLLFVWLIESVFIKYVKLKANGNCHAVKNISMREADCFDIDLLTLLFRSSHVTLIYMIRTFSNTTETFMFILVLYLMEKLKLKDDLPKVFKASFGIGIIVAFGFFVRPSFIAFFAATITMFCLQLLVSNLFMHAFKKGILIGSILIIGILLGSILNIFLDNIYFSTNNEITPLNLISYNADINNLKQHGIHSKVLHFTVNMMLLFGPAYIMFLFTSTKWFFSFIKHSPLDILFVDILRRGECILLTIIPVFILSLVPHHEPRYILPVILPLLCSIIPTLKNSKLLNFFLMCWFVFNFICIVWFGFLHQGGLIPILSKFNVKFRNNHYKDNSHFVFWKTYLVPQHLLGVGMQDTTINIHDLSGCHVENLISTVQNTYSENRKLNLEIFIISPSSVHNQVQNSFQEIRLVDQSYPHVTMEDFPSNRIKLFFKELIPQSLYHDIKVMIAECFTLNVYEVRR